jgi:hypothetical protein
MRRSNIIWRLLKKRLTKDPIESLRKSFRYDMFTSDRWGVAAQAGAALRNCTDKLMLLVAFYAAGQ